MYYKALLYPVLIQVALIFAVLFRMFVQRVQEFKSRRIDPNSVPTRQQLQEKLPDSASASDNLKNLFEFPMLFFAAMLLAITLLIHDPVLAALAWAYVGTRIAHSLIHLTYNKVMHRFYLFAASSFFLLMIWARLGWFIFLR